MFVFLRLAELCRAAPNAACSLSTGSRLNDLATCKSNGMVRVFTRDNLLTQTEQNFNGESRKVDESTTEIIIHGKGAPQKTPLRDELVAMDRHDQAVRAELAADGSLFGGYHPRMAAVHDANAARFRQIVREIGWPTTVLVGPDAANAAHRIALHSINHPDFMRECRAIIKVASDRGEIPREHFAYIDDRIRVYEGLPQLYGTQWRGGVNGLEPYPLDDSKAVNQRRRVLGLPTLDEMRPKSSERLSPEECERQRAEEFAWRHRVGWIQ